MTHDNNSNQKILSTMIVGMVLIVGVLIVAIFVVTRRPVVVVVPAGGIAPAPAAGPPATDPGAAADSAAVAAAPPAELAVSKVDAAPSLDNPLDPFWDKISVTEIPLVPQQVAEPTLASGTVSKVRIQGVRDPGKFLWRLSWDQPSPSTQSDFGQFSDAVALQFPLADGAPYTMGGPNMPVSMLYWKAIWQKDVDQGFQDAVVTKPNAYNDFYWFASQTGPVSADKLMEDVTARQWMVAAASGNPMADFKRSCPLEELSAQGFGTTTHLAESLSQARGKWNQGQWYVVFERTIREGDKLTSRFQQNPQQQLLAIAVWDGAAQNRGGKKNISNWIPMRIAQ